MGGALDAAWEEVGFVLSNKDANPTGLGRLMALRIMAAVRDGEHDHERLKELALDAIAKTYSDLAFATTGATVPLAGW